LTDRHQLFVGARSWPKAALCLLCLIGSLGACGGGDDDDDTASSVCLGPLPKCTTTAFPPTYDNIYKQVLKTTCASSDTESSCHYGPEPEHAQAGLVLSDPEGAYDYLLGKADGRARVVPKDPECSLLIQRIESKDASFRMPVGKDPLKENVRCAIRQWIADGAPRDGGKQ
jgi:hypothetical protein